MSIFDPQPKPEGSEPATPGGAPTEPSPTPEAAPREGSGFAALISYVLVAIFSAVVTLGVSRAVSWKGAENPPAGNQTPSAFSPDDGGSGFTPPGSRPLPEFGPGGFGMGNRPGDPRANPNLGPGMGSPGANPFPGNGPFSGLGNRPQLFPPLHGNSPSPNTPVSHAPVPPRPVPAVSPEELLGRLLPTSPGPTDPKPKPGDLSIERPVEREPRPVRVALIEAGKIAQDSQKGPVAAARYLQRYVDKPDNPQSPRVFAMIGVLWLKVGDADQAHQWFERATQALAPPDGELAPPGNAPMPSPAPDRR